MAEVVAAVGMGLPADTAALLVLDRPDRVHCGLRQIVPVDGLDLTDLFRGDMQIVQDQLGAAL